MSLDLSNIESNIKSKRKAKFQGMFRAPGVLGSLACLALFMPFVLETCGKSTLESYHAFDIATTNTPQAGPKHALLAWGIILLSLSIWAWYLLPQKLRKAAPVVNSILGIGLATTLWASILVNPGPWFKDKTTENEESNHSIEAGFGLVTNLICHVAYLGFGLWLLSSGASKNKKE